MSGETGANWKNWVPALAMTAVSLISYIDRIALALLAPTILADCQLSAEQYGWIISSFSVAYMIGNPLWGRWLDRFGVRAGMLIAVALWTAASTAHALAAGFAAFAAARAVLGFGEGATFPGGLRTVVQTLPQRLRSRGLALAYSGGSLGAVLTPLIVTPIFAAHGWRAAFWFTGLIGLLWLLLWWFAGDRAELRERRSASQPVHRIQWSDARIWSFMANYALGCFPLAFVLYQAPIYFSRALGKQQEELGWVLWIPPLGWEAGYFLWGWILDRTRQSERRIERRYRKLILFAAISTLPLAAGSSISSFPLLLALLFWSMFVAGGNVIVSLGYATDVFGASHAGLLAGLGAGSWSAGVAVLMPVFGRWADAGAWSTSFAAAALIPALGFGAWLAVNSREMADR